MTRILLMRHAKAAPAAPGMSDFERPLETSGQADAARMGVLIRTRWGVPERVVCSGAKRTRETLAKLELGEDVETLFSDELFNGGADDYIAALAAAQGASVLLVGHNPSVHGAAAALAGSGSDALRAALHRGFPTAGLAVIDFDGPLSGLGRGQGRLEAFVTPSEAAAA